MMIILGLCSAQARVKAVSLYPPPLGYRLVLWRENTEEMQMRQMRPTGDRLARGEQAQIQVKVCQAAGGEERRMEERGG